MQKGCNYNDMQLYCMYVLTMYIVCSAYLVKNTIWHFHEIFVVLLNYKQCSGNAVLQVRLTACLGSCALPDSGLNLGSAVCSSQPPRRGSSNVNFFFIFTEKKLNQKIVKLSTTNLTKCSIFVANPISPHKWAFLGGTFSRKKITTIRKKKFIFDGRI